MKKIAALCVLFFMITVGSCFAQSPVDFSVKLWNVNGSFDYYLHWPDSPQLLSQVSGPQNQRMTVFDAKLNLDNQEYITLRYGTTGSGSKGRGSDSDWSVQGSPRKTDYGTMDYSGKQELYALDFGKIISKGPDRAVVVFWGWSKQKTTNGLSNITYHLVNGQDVGSLAQPDNGSRLDGEMDGYHLGVGLDYLLQPKLTLMLEAKASYLKMKAYGHWANHSPPWEWTDSGRTWGQNFSAALKYSFDKNTSVRIGYCYFKAKVTGIDEVLTTGAGTIVLPGMVDIRYMQQGYYFGFDHAF